MDTKVCKKCKQEKVATVFHGKYCLECYNEKRRLIRKGEYVEEAVSVKDGHKICGKCKEEKLLVDFTASEVKKNCGWCKSCVKENNQKWLSENKESNNENKRIYYEENKEYLLVCHREWYQENREDQLAKKSVYYWENKEDINAYKRQYYIENRDYALEYAKQYREDEENKEAMREYQREYHKKRSETDHVFMLRKWVSTSIYDALFRNNGSKRGQSCMEYLPYTIECLENHLKLQFEPWMNWDNHGNYSTKTWNDEDPTTWTWQIDHIIPQSKLPFSSMDEENFLRCWSLTNLRPYSAKQNILDKDRKALYNG